MAPAKKYPRSTRRKDALRISARDHATVLLSKPASYYDDTLTDVTWGAQDDYMVTRSLGKGKYGEVYEVRSGGA
jgi:casein kinase II subunit alpha